MTFLCFFPYSSSIFRFKKCRKDCSSSLYLFFSSRKKKRCEISSRCFLYVICGKFVCQLKCILYGDCYRYDNSPKKLYLSALDEENKIQAMICLYFFTVFWGSWERLMKINTDYNCTNCTRFTSTKDWVCVYTFRILPFLHGNSNLFFFFNKHFFHHWPSLNAEENFIYIKSQK